MTRRLLIVANAPSENLRALREAAAAGARRVAGVETVALGPLEAGPDDVLAASAVLLGTSENFGYMSGQLKDFFERIYYPCLDRTQALPCALYIRAGNDGTGAQRSVEAILAGLRWRLVQEPVVWRGPWRKGFVDEARELAEALAAGLEMGVF